MKTHSFLSKHDRVYVGIIIHHKHKETCISIQKRIVTVIVDWNFFLKCWSLHLLFFYKFRLFNLLYLGIFSYDCLLINCRGILLLLLLRIHENIAQ